LVHPINKSKKNLLKKLYQNMYLIRHVEESISKKYAEGKMRCPVHLSIGQEIVSAAFSQIMRKKDYAVSSHRCHGHYLSKGGDLNSMIAEIYGKETGCSGGKGGSMHLIDLNVNFMGSSAIVGNSIPIGAGLAMGSKLKNEKKLSFVYFGDGAIEEGVFYESINFAVVKKLPVVFICENNLYSVYSNLNPRQPYKRSISSLAKSIGVHSVKLDTDDIYKMYLGVKKNMKYVSNYNKPIFFELMTYRYKEHCGPNNDDQLNYRSIKEINLWKKKDPLEKFLTKKLLSDKTIKKINKLVHKKTKKAFIFAENSKFPKIENAYKKLYA
tara:strand:+ start:707 stop:1681 length:975 start_codon:yes stop_codon:yes gene_type:complete